MLLKCSHPLSEWEGFAHIVLHCWLENEQPGRSPGSVKSEVEEQAPLLALLLHVAIRLLSDSDPTLRMVCMVAANLPSSNNSRVTAISNSIRSSHGSPSVSNSIRSIQQLREILSKIHKKCNFDEALSSIKLTVSSSKLMQGFLGSTSPTYWGLTNSFLTCSALILNKPRPTSAIPNKPPL